MGWNVAGGSVLVNKTWSLILPKTLPALESKITLKG